MPRPVVPVPDELTKPFWDACNERRLVIQNCKACNRLQYPPEKTCAECDTGQHLEWREVQGRGSINGYVVVHDSRLQAFWVHQPYNIAVIELEEDPDIKFFSNLPGMGVDEVPIGAPVELIFEEAAPGQLVPEWQVMDETRLPSGT